MTLMKESPLPTFSKGIRSVLLKSVKDTAGQYGIVVQDEPQVVRNSIFISGDYLSGIRISGATFQGAVTLSMDRTIARAFAEKIFAGTNVKDGESMLCDLVGEVCNQFTGAIQRGLGSLGCKIKVSAQEVSQDKATFDSGISPNEWLTLPFTYESGRAFLAFGFVGELGLGQDDPTEDLSDARNITFF